MKNSEYWKLRFKQLENAANTSASETLSFVDEQYKAAVKDIESQISIWYSRFAKNNSITIQEARQWLSSKQLKELQWDVDEYIKYGQENGLNAGWMKELENASAKFHISKLEALKMQTQMTCDKLFGSQLGAVGKMAKKTYLDGYYHSAYEIQKGLNVGWDIAGIDENKLLKVIGKPWTTDGKNFSERIWSNRSSLISETHKQLTQDILLGRSPDDSIKAISKKFSTSKSQAGRLVMTESAYFSSEAQKDCFNELDVEQFEVVETLDGTTCEICGSMDGQVFDMKDFEPGTTAPPFHPWCRGCTVPYFDDNFTERAARDNEGKTYYVPSEMKYTEWKDKFIDDGDKSDLDVYDENGVVHYVKHDEPEIITPVEEVKPKKEYLTKKKLQANIANADVDIENLNNEFENVTYGYTLDDIKTNYGGIEKFADKLNPNDSDYLSKLQGLSSQIDQLELQKSEWQTKLNEKLKKEQKKLLLKQQIDLQQQFDDFEIETYSGIWKDDVTTADWKGLNIEGKKKYYESKFISETDPDLMKKYQDLYKQLDDFDVKGKAYYEIQSELKKVQADLTKLENGDILSDATEVFSQERKDNALWAKTTKEADDVLRDVSGDVWKNAPKTEQDAIYDYTSSYSKFNEPLRGIEYGTNKYLGVGNVDLNQIGVNYGGYKPGQVKKKIDAMTDIINKSSYSQDIWVQRGCGFKGMDKFFEIDASDFNLSEHELQKLLLKKEVTDYGFFSTGVAKGKGFSNHPIIMNVYCPSGTKMMYAEPFSAFGNGAGKQWDGVSPQSSFGNESEMILQRGTKFRITKVEKSNGTIYIDLEVIEQVVN